MEEGLLTQGRGGGLLKPVGNLLKPSSSHQEESIDEEAQVFVAVEDQQLFVVLPPREDKG